MPSLGTVEALELGQAGQPRPAAEIGESFNIHGSISLFPNAATYYLGTGVIGGTL